MKQLNFSTFPILKTSRLVLRELSAQDALQLHALRSDPKVAAMTGRIPSTSIEDAMVHICKIRKLIEDNASVYWVISLLDDPALIGTICLWNFDIEKAVAEIGYELLPEFHGKGMMRETIAAVINYGFKEIGLSTITAFPAANNTSSIKVLKMAGFKIDEKVYSNTHDDLINMLTFSLTSTEQ